MRSSVTIFITAIYIAFTVGITLHIHQCSDGYKDSKIVLASSSDDHCETESSHACCSEPVEISCCEQSSSEDDCCYDGQVFIQLEQPQVVSKSMLLFTLPNVSTQNHEDLLDLYTEDSIQKEMITHPPPLIEDKHILFCSFTFYG